MASFLTFCSPIHFVKDSVIRSRLQDRVQCLSNDESTFLSSDSVTVNGNSSIKKRENNEALKVEKDSGEKPKNGGVTDTGNGRLKPVVETKRVKNAISKNLEVLWDDGCGSKTVRDYLDEAKQMINPDEGLPRWFCPVECGGPLKDSPVLLFLPGIDGVGLGLILHHKALGKVFEVRCLHIPVYNRTPFEELVQFVEETVRLEHASSPNKTIYLVGDSVGGCLALAVAARNPTIDLVLILVNPATSFDRSQLQPLMPILEALPDGLHNNLFPYLIGFVIGDPIKMALANTEYKLPPRIQIEQLSSNLIATLPILSTSAEIFPKETLLWKLKLLKSAAAYANSRLHAVKAEVLVIASGKDNLLPSGDEAKRLKNLLRKCNVRYFIDNGHALLFERGINLLTIIKGTTKYRRSRQFDIVADYVPPSMSEFRCAFDKVVGLLRFATGSATFSTLDDGRIVKGLAGVPTDGPVIFVGYHMLMGLEIYSFVEEILREKKIMVRGMTHLELFTGRMENVFPELSMFDWMRVMGAIPASPSNLFKLLSEKSHVLLYPGGAREALHCKDEEYKLFWPDQPEFVRMAAKFGATIVPFGTVGEDDLAELVLDYNDLMKIPVLNDYIKETFSHAKKMRDESKGEVANQRLYMPGVLPKVPGRLYFLFGKPIKTAGRKEILEDREGANELYLQVKSEVDRNLAYLLKKREEDPYRNVIDRTIYRALHWPLHEIPSFLP